MLVTEKLRQDIESFRQRMLQEQSPNAERWERKTGELEERVSLLKLRHAELLRKLLESVQDETDRREPAPETQVQREADTGISSSERMRMRLTQKA